MIEQDTLWFLGCIGWAKYTYDKRLPFEVLTRYLWAGGWL